MRKLMLVARHEYLRFVRRKAFLLGIVGLPGVLLLMAGIGALTALGQTDPVIGYVDEAGVLRPEALQAGYAEDLERSGFRSYPSAEEGRAAVAEESVGILFVVPADYLSDRSLTAYAPDSQYDQGVTAAFGAFLEASLAFTYGAETAELLVEGPDLTVRTADGSREASGAEGFFAFMLPFVAGFLFIVAAVTSAGYLLQAVSDEKENRTVEILTTSVSPQQLIIGKATGLIGVAATQLGVWTLGLGAALAVGARYVDVLRTMDIPWGTLGLVVGFFVPSYLLLAGIMIVIGAAFPEYRQSQQVVAVINIFFFAPFFFTVFIFGEPNGPLATALTIFPTTSLVTVSLRSAVVDIPLWQLGASWSVLTATAAAVVGLAPRVFRAGMLRYGQRLDLPTLARAARTGGR